MNLDIVGTRVLKEIQKANTRFIALQGGARSSKTYSALQSLILNTVETEGEVITIARKTFPSLRATVMRDFFEILMKHDLYNQSSHNKTESTYDLDGTLFEFMSLDQPQKKRGGKRDRLFLNEANEFRYEDFKQLNMRTTKQVILDYNPSDEYHWIYETVLGRKETTYIQSTYRDNPYCPQSVIDEIEYLKDVDPSAYRIYGLGEKGLSVATIYTNWEMVDSYPEEVDEERYGIDFGFNNPTSITRCGVKDKTNLYIDEVLYETRLTNSQLIDRLNSLGVPKSAILVCDSAEPDRIQELRNAGFNARPAKKGKNSVKDGIDSIKRYKMFITERSVNIKKEVQGYKWKIGKDERMMDEPVKFNDHSMDGIRYAFGTKRAKIGIIELG